MKHDEPVPIATADASFGRYRLVSLLGRGGMAEVFLAKALGAAGFEKTIVIKRILPTLAESSSFVGMFIQEAKLAVRLSHANIVHVFDLGTVDEPGHAPAYFMAMEHVAGMDLATLLARYRQRGEHLADPIAAFVAAEVARGLDHAHRRRDDAGRALGIVHRDISPQNVLLSWDGEVKVTDFGIAKARDFDERPPDNTSLRKLKGKHAYMSPEQARSEAVDARSDLFSLGVVLYEALSGVLPYKGPTPFETLRRAQACEIPPIEAVRPDVPRELASILSRVLQPAPADRYGTAAELLEALTDYLYRTGRGTPSELAKVLAELHDDHTPGPPKSSGEKTPVEVPDSVSRRSTGTSGVFAPRSPSSPPELAKFVGRKDILGQLGSILGGVPKRERVVATLEGEPGVGKSRLVAEIARRVARGSLKILVVRVTCPSHREARHLSTIAATLRALVGEVRPHDPSQSLRGYGLVDDEVKAVEDLFDARARTPAAHALASALTKIVKHLCEERTLLLALDDAHAMDEGSARVLREVTPRLSRSKQLLLLVGREGTLSRFAALHPTELRIGPLDEDDARLLFTSLVGTPLGETEHGLVARAGNNPLFLEQLAMERRVAPELTAEAVPDSLVSFIAQRRERLTREATEAAEALAVLGERGSVETLEAVLGRPSRPQLEELAALGFVVEEAGRARFAAQLVREVIERGLVAARAKELHLAAARALTGGAPDEVLAAHRAAAGQHGEAFSIYASAARDHLAHGRFPAAAEAALSAVRACLLGEDGDPAILAAVLDVLARALAHARVLRDEDNLLALAVAYLDAKGGDVGRARLDVARAYAWLSRFDEATRELGRAGDLDPRGTSKRALIEAEIASKSGNFLGVLDAASGVDRTLLDEEERRRFAICEAQSLGAIGRREEALSAMQPVGEPRSDPDAQTLEILKLHGLIHYFARDYQASARASSRAADMARTLGLPYETATCLHNAADALFRLGERDAALSTFRASVAVAQAAGGERMVWKNEAFIAYLEGLAGVPGRETLLRAAVDRAVEFSYRWDEMDARYLLGLHLVEQALPSQAEQQFTQCLALAQESGNRLLVEDCRAALDGLKRRP